jgi:hypothetical protein
MQEKDIARDFHNAGLKLATQGDLDGAIACWSQALLYQPDAIETLEKRSWAYYRRGDLSQALSDVDKLLAIAPDSPKARWERALIMAGKGAYDLAIAEVDHVIESGVYQPLPVSELNRLQGAWWERYLQQTAPPPLDQPQPLMLRPKDAPLMRLQTEELAAGEMAVVNPGKSPPLINYLFLLWLGGVIGLIVVPFLGVESWFAATNTFWVAAAGLLLVLVATREIIEPLQGKWDTIYRLLNILAMPLLLLFAIVFSVRVISLLP